MNDTETVTLVTSKEAGVGGGGQEGVEGALRTRPLPGRLSS